MSSFDFAKFIHVIRTNLGKGEEIIDRIEQAWQDEEKDSVKKNSHELLKHSQSYLTVSQLDVLTNLHKKILKGKKGSLATKLRSGKEGKKSKIQQSAQNEMDENDLVDTDTDTIDSSENITTGSVDEKSKEETEDMETSTNGMSTSQNDASETKGKHGQDTEGEKSSRIREMELESPQEQTSTSEQENETLRNQNKALEEEKKEIEDSNRRLEEDLKRKTAKLEKERKEKDALENRLEEMKKAMEEKSAELERSEASLKDISKKHENLATRVKTLEDDNQTADVQLQRYKEGLKKSNEEYNQQGQQLELSKDEVESLTDKIKTIKLEKEKLSSHNTVLIAEKDKAVKRSEDLNSELISLKEQASIKERDNKTLRIKNKALIEEKKDIEDRLEKMRRSMEKKNVELERSKTSLGEIDEKNKELATRLSAVAGAKLQHNNPHISDLSDKDRPTKLSEKYSELYDNEWTNAFLALEKSNSGTEEEIIKRLLEILADCFTECQIKAKEQLDQVKAVLLSPAGVTKQDADNEKTKEGYSFTELQEKSITDLVKQTADVSYEDLFQVILGRHTELPKKKVVKQYIRVCTELCWKMAVQTPPLYLNIFEFGGGKLDKQIFKEYTKVGRKIAFVVWPPLYLHEGGPLLCKGTAQGGD